MNDNKTDFQKIESNVNFNFLKRFEEIIKTHYSDVIFNKIEDLKILDGNIIFKYSGVIYTCPIKTEKEILERIKRAKIIEDLLLEIECEKKEVKTKVKLILFPKKNPN